MDGKEALFEWQDGPLVDCLKTGEVILVDEISLADDAVLERHLARRLLRSGQQARGQRTTTAPLLRIRRG